MKKRHIPIDWQQPDSRRYRFPLPNSVWEYRLKPTEFVLLSYLCYRHSCGDTDSLTPELIATGIHKAASTTKKYLDTLMGKGLITDKWLLSLSSQCSSGKKFFTLPNEIFLLNLPSSAFMVYAYLLLIEDRKTHTCHPSYSTIAADTGMSKNTLIKSVNTLLDKGLVTMEYSRYIDQCGMKWKGNNLYTILPIRQAMDSFYQQQLCQMVADTERRRFQERQSALCARPDAGSRAEI